MTHDNVSQTTPDNTPTEPEPLEFTASALWDAYVSGVATGAANVAQLAYDLAPKEAAEYGSAMIDLITASSTARTTIIDGFRAAREGQMPEGFKEIGPAGGDQ